MGASRRCLEEPYNEPSLIALRRTCSAWLLKTDPRLLRVTEDAMHVATAGEGGHISASMLNEDGEDRDMGLGLCYLSMRRII